MTHLTIGDLAAATGSKVETIRYYERIGLLPPPARTAGNYRAFDATHLARLSFVRRARDLGFSLDEIRDLAALADQRDRCCDGVDAIARRHLADVDRKLADLHALRDELAGLVAACAGGTIAECRIVEALAPRPRPADEAGSAGRDRRGSKDRKPPAAHRPR